MKPILTSLLAVFMAGAGGGLAEADNASPADKTFIATFSQPVMFEVAMGQLAATQASTRRLRLEGTFLAHDHSPVVAQMKAAAASDGVAFPSTLDGALLDELDHAKALHGKEFDTTFISDMISIDEADLDPIKKQVMNGQDTYLAVPVRYEYRMIESDLERFQSVSKSLGK